MEWNRMNIQQELEELKSRIAEIEKAVKEKAVKGTEEKAKGIQLNTGEYVVLSDGVIQKIPRNYPNKDVNNCWLTEQQAVKAAKIMSAVFELKQLCDIINEGRKPDFEDDDECKYYILYDHVNSQFFMDTNFAESCHSVYFKRNCLDEISPVMSDNLKAYIKGEL
jgi:hypothetical protein